MKEIEMINCPVCGTKFIPRTFYPEEAIFSTLDGKKLSGNPLRCHFRETGSISGCRTVPRRTPHAEANTRAYSLHGESKSTSFPSVKYHSADGRL